MTIAKPDKFEKWKFENAKRRKSLPSEIITKDQVSKSKKDAEHFLLTLAVMFNDIKNVTILYDTIVWVYEKPIKGRHDSHTGELAGIELYLAKLLVGHFLEISKFLKEKRSVYESEEINSLIDKLPSKDKDSWESIYTFLVKPKNDNGKDTKEEGRLNDFQIFIDKLARIRGNVSFHYSDVELARGFRRFFYGKIKYVPNEANEYALRSLLKTSFEDSRYYYADAAIQGYFTEVWGDKHDQSEFIRVVLSNSGIICSAINSLLNKYFEERPQH